MLVERVKGARSARVLRLFRLRLKASFKAKYCFWFLSWFSLWNLAMALCSIHPLIVGLIAWVPTTLIVIKLADA
jgi:hypothetical protein